MKIKNNKGQAMLEMLLLTVLIFGAWTGVSTLLRNNGTFESIFGTPWDRLVNTIEFGVPNTKNNNGNLHPAHADRHSTRISH